MTSRKSALTHARILKAARPLFLANGFDETSTAAICRAANVSNGSFFHQFATKEDLAFAVYCEIRGEFWGGVFKAMLAPADPLDGIEAAVRQAVRYHREAGAAAAFLGDVGGSGWIERYAAQALPFYQTTVARGLEWARPHIAAGRLPDVSPDAFIALVSGAPQWIGRMIRIGMATASLQTIEDELARLVRRAFEV